MIWIFSIDYGEINMRSILMATLLKVSVHLHCTSLSEEATLNLKINAFFGHVLFKDCSPQTTVTLLAAALGMPLAPPPKCDPFGLVLRREGDSEHLVDNIEPGGCDRPPP